MLLNYKAKSEYVVSFCILDLLIDLGFGIFKKHRFQLKGVNKYDLDEDTAEKAKRALINLMGGKKRKKSILIEVAFGTEKSALPEIDVYVPDMSYGEFDLTIGGETYLHVNRVMSWLYDYKFEFEHVVSILNANKSKNKT